MKKINEKYKLKIKLLEINNEPMKDGGEVEYDIYEVDSRELLFNPFNGRVSSQLIEKYKTFKQGDKKVDKEIYEILKIDKNIDKLKASMKDIGQIYPAIVTKDGYVIDANRRLAVCRELKIPIKVIYLKGDYPFNLKTFSLLETSIQFSIEIDRQGYSAIAKRLKIKSMYDSLSKKIAYIEIKKRLNVSKPHIDETLSTLKLIDEYNKLRNKTYQNSAKMYDQFKYSDKAIRVVHNLITSQDYNFWFHNEKNFEETYKTFLFNFIECEVEGKAFRNIVKNIDCIESPIYLKETFITCKDELEKILEDSNKSKKQKRESAISLLRKINRMNVKNEEELKKHEFLTIEQYKKSEIQKKLEKIDKSISFEEVKKTLSKSVPLSSKQYLELQKILEEKRK